MAGKDDFTIETKLKIAGVEATGKLDAGTLRFDVDTSSLQKLVQDAGKAAQRVKSKFDKLQLKKLKVEVNQNSLRTIEAQIRKAINNAVGKVNLQAGTVGVKGDPFKDQRAAAVKSANALKRLHELTKQTNQGLRSLINTLSRANNMRIAGQAGPATGAEPSLPLPPTARTVSASNLDQEIQAMSQMSMMGRQLTDQELRGIQQVEAARAKADAARLRQIEKLKGELDTLFRKEQRLTTQLAGGGGAGGGGNIPPGGFGATPPGGDFGGKSNVQQLAAAMQNVETNTRGANSAMLDLSDLSEQVFRKAAAFRGVAIAINTVANAAQGAAQFLIQFSDSLREINKILQVNSTTLRVVGDELFELAASTGVAVDKTVEIATEFARAGLTGRGYGTVVELTERALTGLQGTTLDASQATQVLIQVIQQVEAGARGLSKELITTGKLFDILGRGEDITAAKALDVAEALKRSAASLFATGAAAEEVSSVIFVLQERTQRGGEVIGTALKTLASRIANSSSEASQALRSIGVETVDAQGRLRNIFDVLRDTSVAFQGLSEAEQANIAVKAAGVRQVEVFRAALNDFNRIQEVQNELSEASGDAARKQAVEQEKLSVTIETNSDRSIRSS